MITEDEIRLGLTVVSHKYGLEFARKLERLYRNETEHFKSGNFSVTHAAGMEAHANTLPWGWTSLKEFWDKNPNFEPVKLFLQVENDSAIAKAEKKPKKFLVFRSVEASMMTAAYFIHTVGKGNFGRWFALDSSPDLQEKYNKSLSQIKARLI